MCTSAFLLFMVVVVDCYTITDNNGPCRSFLRPCIPSHYIYLCCGQSQCASRCVHACLRACMRVVGAEAECVGYAERYNGLQPIGIRIYKIIYIHIVYYGIRKVKNSGPAWLVYKSNHTCEPYTTTRRYVYMHVCTYIYPC